MTDTPATDPIDAYLDRLLSELRGDPHEIRRILTEIEGHLHDGIDAAVAHGMSLEDAQRQALERCGSPTTVARRFAADHPARLFHAGMIRQLVLAALLLGGIGLVAVGVSGGLAAGMGAVGGKRFVSGDVPGMTYTPARCAYFLEYYAKEGTCAKAATAHHFDEVVQYRVAAGVLGLLVLGTWQFARRRRRSLIEVGLLPDAFVATAGVTVFAAGAGMMMVQGMGQVSAGTTAGLGDYLSGAIVAAVVAVGFAFSLMRTLGRRAASAVAA
jgi:hypothetical protein